MKKFWNWLKGLFGKGETYSDGSSSGLGGVFNAQNWRNQFDSMVNDSDYLPGQKNSLSDTFSNLFGSSFSDLMKALTNRVTANNLTGAEREQNAFNASEAQRQRNFELQMSRSEYQRAVEDMQAAGVNPAMAMNNGGNSSPSGVAASGSGSGQYQSMSDLMQLAFMKPQLEIMRSQADNIKADTEKKRADTGLTNKQIDVFGTMTDAQLKDIYSLIGQRDAAAALSRQGINESEARQALNVQQTILSKIDADYRARLNEASLKYQEAVTSFTNQRTKESEELVKKYAAEIDGIYQQAILQAAQASYFDQAEINLLKQADILDYEADEHRFTVDHQKSDRNWRLATSAISTALQAGGTVAGAMIGVGSLAKAGMIGRTSVTASPWHFTPTGDYNFITY